MKQSGLDLESTLEIMKHFEVDEVTQAAIYTDEPIEAY